MRIAPIQLLLILIFSLFHNSCTASHAEPMVAAAPSPARHIAINKTELLTNLDWVHHVAWRPDNKVFAVIGTKGTGDLKEFSVLVYDAATHHVIQTLPVKSLGSMIGTIAFSPDGKYLAAGRGVITLWDANTWQPVRDILGPYVRGFVSEGVSRMAFSPDGASLAVLYSSVSWPETVRIRFKEEGGPWLKREKESKKDGTFWEKLARGDSQPSRHHHGFRY